MSPSTTNKQQQRDPDDDSSSSASSCSDASKASDRSSETSTTTTTVDDERIESSAASVSRNRCISCCIVLLGIFAMACGVYSTLSCEWFAWTPLEETNAWGVFAIDSTANQAESVGLFRYFFETDEASNNRIQATFSCQLYSDLQNNDWLLISWQTDPWMFTAQLCWVIATVLAALSTLATLPQCCCCCCCCGCRSLSFCKATSTTTNGRRSALSCCASCGWLLASGLQAASCLAATALCGGYDFWECPWLQGAHASAGAAWFYLLCWLLSVCGYRLVGSSSTTMDTDRRVTIHNHHHHHHHRRRAEEEVEECPDDLEVGENKTTNYKLSAEELLGTDDPIIHRAVGQKAETIREFAVAQPMEDFDDDDDDDDDEDDDGDQIEDEIKSETGMLDESTTATPKTKNTAVDP